MGTHQPFTVRSNWNWVDQLDGTDLADGEQLQVLWPSGRETQETVRLVQGRTDVSDHGHIYRAQDDRGYIDVMLYGLKIEVPLRGSTLKAKRVL